MSRTDISYKFREFASAQTEKNIRVCTCRELTLSMSRHDLKSFVRWYVYPKLGYTFDRNWEEHDNKGLYALFHGGPIMVHMCDDVITAVLEYELCMSDMATCNAMIYEWVPSAFSPDQTPYFVLLSPKRLRMVRGKVQVARLSGYLRSFFIKAREYFTKTKTINYLKKKIQDILLYKRFKTRTRVVQYLSFMRFALSLFKWYIEIHKTCSYCSQYTKTRMLCGRCHSVYFCDKQVIQKYKSLL